MENWFRVTDTRLVMILPLLPGVPLQIHLIEEQDQCTPQARDQKPSEHKRTAFFEQQ